MKIIRQSYSDDTEFKILFLKKENQLDFVVKKIKTWDNKTINLKKFGNFSAANAFYEKTINELSKT